MKHLLSCTTTLRSDRSLDSDHIDQSVDLDPTELVKTLWILKTKMSSYTLRKLMTGIKSFCEKNNLSLEKENEDKHE